MLPHDEMLELVKPTPDLNRWLEMNTQMQYPEVTNWSTTDAQANPTIQAQKTAKLCSWSIKQVGPRE
jgi:hypothetical protein